MGEIAALPGATESAGERASDLGRNLVYGAARVFSAEALVLPTGLLTAAILSRGLGPTDYGLLTVAATVVSLVEFAISSYFGRATVKLVGESDDWRPVGAAVVRLSLAAGCLAALALIAGAGTWATLLGAPRLATCLGLFALDVPVRGLARSHQYVLVGLGRFRERAWGAAVYWLGRLGLVMVLALAGISLEGVALAHVGASGLELAVTRRFVQPPLWGPLSIPLRRLSAYGAPLLFFGLAMRLYDTVDVVAVQRLGGVGAEVGFYGAAKNVALVPGILGVAFSPLLLSSLSRALRDGRGDEARALARNALRAALWLLAPVALLAGSSPEVVALVFGEAFAPAAPILALLLAGAVGQLAVAAATATLTAAGRPLLTFLLVAPLAPSALLGYWFVVPTWGALGAALVMACLAGLAAVACLVAACTTWRLSFPLGSLARALLVGTGAFALGAVLPGPGLWLLLKLAALSAGALAALWVSGELSAAERAFVRSAARDALRRGTVSAAKGVGTS